MTAGKRYCSPGDTVLESWLRKSRVLRNLVTSFLNLTRQVYVVLWFPVKFLGELYKENPMAFSEENKGC